MDKSNQYDWVDFYKELACKLVAYKDNRMELIRKIRSIYEENGFSLPTLEKDNNIVDSDPFTVFGLFNKKQSQENRIKLLTSFAEKFGVVAEVPTSFDSIPVLNNQNATFYYFVDARANDDIDNLWELFKAALNYVDRSTSENRVELSKYFDITINKKGNGNSKITMGLYWISPSTFLNLDSRNEWYIYESGRVPQAVVAELPPIEPKISSSKYFKIVERLRAYLMSDESKLKDFKELSFEAWRYSEEVNQEKKEEKAKSQRDAKGTALADEDVDTVHYWIYSPGDSAFKWEEFYKKGIMAIGWGGLGDLKVYKNKDDMKQKMRELINPNRHYKNDALATWQFANEMKVGDIVFVKKGMHQLVGRGVVVSDYEFDPSVEDDYQNIRHVNWIDNGEWEHPGQAVMKTLTDITAYTDYVTKLNALFEENVLDNLEVEDKVYPEYDKEKFLEEVFMDGKSYDNLVDLVRKKKNVVLQGAPGVGKTFAAKRLAYSMMGLKDQERIMMIQFHQSYTYEDFIEGFRPSGTGLNFEIKKGSFYNFCKKAADNLEKEYFFIIDEINRGNLSKIFGELFVLIENDKRGNSLQLLYSDEKFFVPENVLIIGMMNTADRSLAMLDYALRRRFAFYEMKPSFSSEGFRNYQTSLNNTNFDHLINCVDKLNNAIEADDSLGDGFSIGHSYFCNLDDVNYQVLSNLVEYELIPLLKEYWFDEPQKVKDWSNNLRSSIK